MKRLNFPYTAILGQERMRKALILNLIDPQIGGVLLTGHQGTGKSTAVRSLTDILPDIEIVEGCPFSCDPHGDPDLLCNFCRDIISNGKKLTTIIKSIPLVDLPLGVTEDMVTGSLDLEMVLTKGIKSLHSGLLAKSNRGILYIDEVNLLQDHIVDILLDVAASGINIIEREGVSIDHPAKFVLVGSMNPEEGELRPQINDRFGLEVTINTPKDPAVRSEITKRVIDFTDNPKSFIKKYESKQNELKEKIIQAKKRVKQVEIPVSLYKFASDLVTELEIQSQRADITFIRCSRANAAFRGGSKVEMIDLDSALDLVFEHRLRALRDDIEPEEIKDKIKDIYGKIKEAYESNTAYQPNRDMDGPLKSSDNPQKEFKRQPYDPDKVKGLPETKQPLPDNPDMKNWKRNQADGLKVAQHHFGKKFTVDDLIPVKERYQKKIFSILSIFERGKKVTNFAGRGSRTKVTSFQKGRYVAFKHPIGPPRSIAFDASIKRSLVRNLAGNSIVKDYNLVADSVVSSYGAGTSTYANVGPKIQFPLKIEKSDIMEKVFELKAPLSVYFILDASGSMARYIKQMSEIIRSLNVEGYKKKDKTSIIVFQGKKAFVLQRPTTNVSRIIAKLPSIKGNSYTPLASALHKTMNMIKAERMKNNDIIPVVVICSDLGANISLKFPDLKAQTQEDFRIIAEELKNIAKRFARQKIRVLILNPKKGRAIKYLGVNPWAMEKIRNAFKQSGAEIFELDGYNPQQTIIKLKKIL
ncbi:MAG: ATP-binding protein [Promethearchaeota archaeon]